MRAEIETVLADIDRSLALLRSRLGWENACARLKALDAQAEDPDLWQDPARAQRVMRERGRLQAAIEGCLAIEREAGEHRALIEMGEEEGEDAIVQEASGALLALRARAAQREIETLLSGEADGNDAWLEIHAGAGGTESCDWAAMLARMYTRWADAHGYKADIMSENAGEETGIKSAIYEIKGENAYGWLKTESGVHRLVRISPFDAQGRRHTSFSSVWVYPVVDDDIAIEIHEKDLRIDTFRSSGAGGQHVNTTDSSVRITHIPTGIVVTASEKSQHQNRASAMRALRARLYERELKRREEERQALEAEKSEIGWGRQIRSYVLQPYQMVKDLRTNVESSDTAGVLDGDLDAFMAASLAALATPGKGDWEHEKPPMK